MEGSLLPKLDEQRIRKSTRNTVRREALILQRWLHSGVGQAVKDNALHTIEFGIALCSSHRIVERYSLCMNHQLYACNKDCNHNRTRTKVSELPIASFVKMLSSFKKEIDFLTCKRYLLFRITFLPGTPNRYIPRAFRVDTKYHNKHSFTHGPTLGNKKSCKETTVDRDKKETRANNRIKSIILGDFLAVGAELNTAAALGRVSSHEITNLSSMPARSLNCRSGARPSFQNRCDSDTIGNKAVAIPLHHKIYYSCEILGFKSEMGKKFVKVRFKSKEIKRSQRKQWIPSTRLLTIQECFDKIRRVFEMEKADFSSSTDTIANKLSIDRNFVSLALDTVRRERMEKQWEVLSCGKEDAISQPEIKNFDSSPDYEISMLKVHHDFKVNVNSTKICHIENNNAIKDRALCGSSRQNSNHISEKKLLANLNDDMKVQIDPTNIQNREPTGSYIRNGGECIIDELSECTQIIHDTAKGGTALLQIFCRPINRCNSKSNENPEPFLNENSTVCSDCFSSSTISSLSMATQLKHCQRKRSIGDSQRTTVFPNHKVMEKKQRQFSYVMSPIISYFGE